MESPDAKEKGDWRDQWIRKTSQPRPHTREVNDKLPDPGYTNSTSWLSTLPSSDGPSQPSRHYIPTGSIARHLIPESGRSPVKEEMIARNMYRHPSLDPLDRRGSEEGGPRTSNEPVYPFPDNPTTYGHGSHNTSNHQHHSQAIHPHHNQESRSIHHRNIHMNQQPFPPDARSHQVYQDHTPYPTYSPLPHSHSHSYPYPHSLPSPRPYLNPDLKYNSYAQPHGDIPQTPIFQVSRDTNTDLGMNIPPPFSTPGPSHLPKRAQHLEPYSNALQWNSNNHTALSEQDQLPYQLSSKEVMQDEGLEGFWKSTRLPVHNGIEQGPFGMSMGMDVDQAPAAVFDQYGPLPDYPPTLPSHNGPHALSFPQQHYQDPTNPCSTHSHQHQSHDASHIIPPQAYFTSRIQHQLQYNGFERRSQTPLSTSNHYDSNHQGGVLGDFHEDGMVGDKENEIMEFGASRDEWKLLWSDRKANR